MKWIHSAPLSSEAGGYSANNRDLSVISCQLLHKAGKAITRQRKNGVPSQNYFLGSTTQSHPNSQSQHFSTKLLPFPLNYFLFHHTFSPTHLYSPITHTFLLTHTFFSHTNIFLSHTHIFFSCKHIFFTFIYFLQIYIDTYFPLHEKWKKKYMYEGRTYVRERRMYVRERRM